jgi:hypothetical protein
MAAIFAFLVVHIALTILVPKTFVAMVVGRATGGSHHPGRPHPEASPKESLP